MKSALHFLIASKRSEIAGLHRLALTSALVNALGRLIHAMQRERGLSNLYLGSQGLRWADERLQQLAACDRLQAEVRDALDQLDTDAALSGHTARLFGRIAYALQGLDELPALRRRVQTLEWTAVRASAAYARLIGALLAVVFEAADSAWDPEISRHLVAFFNFMQGKEFAGQERATGAAVFAAGRVDHDSQQRLLHLIDSQERCVQVFTDFARPALQASWQASQRHEHLLPLERMRRILCTAREGSPLDAGLTQTWFDTCTARMEAMKTVEDTLASELLALCEQRQRSARDELAALERLSDRIGDPRTADEAHPGPGFFDEREAVPPLPLSITHPEPSFGPQVGRSILELVRDQAQRLQSMGDELDTVRSSLNERKTIERAKGLLMAHRQLSEDEAHKTMRQMAMNQNRRLVEVAEAVLAMASVLPPPSP